VTLAPSDVAIEGPAATAAGPARAHPGRRAFAVVALGLGLLVVLSLWHLDQGRSSVGVGDLLDLLTGNATEQARAVIIGSRLPRLAAATALGACLGAAGVLLQSITRNALAEPGTMGVASGAFFAVTLAVVAGVGRGPLPAGGIAFVGGGIAAAIVLGIGARGGADGARLLLAGMAVSLTLYSATAVLLLWFEQATSGLFLWGSGTLVQSGFARLEPMLPVMAAGLGAAWLLGRRLDVLALGDATAGSLGVRAGRTRSLAAVIAVVLTAAAVAVAGPIGFIGLLGPHAVRRFGVVGTRRVVVAGAVWGAVALVFADLCTQLVRGDSLVTEMPTGAVTALLGAPLLIWIARTMPSAGAAPAFTGRARVPYPAVTVGAAALAGALVVAGLALGDVDLSPAQVVSALAGEADDLATKVVLDLRLPRVLVAALAGAALAAGGVVLQAVTRNPLADPLLLGVSGGAEIGALTLILLLDDAPLSLLPFAAFAGAVIVLGVVLAAAWRNGLAPDRLALVGIGAAAFTAAVVSLLVVRAQLRLAQALVWLAGSTYARDAEDVRLLVLWPVVVIPVLWLAGRHLDLLGLGDAAARSLGLRVDGTRLATLLLACALAAAAVASVGTIGFVGLLAPHLARPLTGPTHRLLLPVAALAGAALVTSADLIGRVLFAPREIPAGLVVAVIGAPFFLWLLWRTRPITT
jgi:ABC-type Fe3+-siderophore transport system permease subunit